MIPSGKKLLLFAADHDIEHVMMGLIHAMTRKKLLAHLKNVEDQVRSVTAGGVFDTLLFRLENTVEELIRIRKRFPWTHCLVITDRKVSGQQVKEVDRMKEDFQTLLRVRAPDVVGKLIIIDPEVESWLWGVGRGHWTEALKEHTGKSFSVQQIREAFQHTGDPSKPEDPKASIRDVLRLLQVRKSSVLYESVAMRSSHRDWQRCRSSSFQEVYSTLQEWFA